MRLSILLVDDNAIQAATRKAVLERAGQTVLIALGGEAAIQLLSDPKGSSQIGLIITDHVMPGMNGVEFVTAVRRMNTDLPIVVLSGLADAESCYDNFAVIFRMKPLPPEQLIQLSGDLLRNRMARTA